MVKWSGSVTNMDHSLQDAFVSDNKLFILDLLEKHTRTHKKARVKKEGVLGTLCGFGWIRLGDHASKVP